METKIPTLEIRCGSCKCDVPDLFYISRNTDFYSSNGKKSLAGFYIAMLICGDSSMLQKWNRLHRGKYQVKFVLEGREYPFRMDSYEMIRIPGSKAADLRESLSSDDINGASSSSIKDEEGKLGDRVSKIRENTFSRAEEEIPIDLCTSIARSSLHWTVWSKIFEMTGKVYCSVYKGTYGNVLHITDSFKPAEEPDGSYFTTPIQDLVLHAVRRVRKNTTFVHGEEKNKSYPIDANAVSFGIVMNPDRMREWEKLHGDYEYSVICTMNADKVFELKRDKGK